MDATFQRLDLGEKAVVVTGKGYAEVAKWELLAMLSDMGTPVFASLTSISMELRSRLRCDLTAKPRRTESPRCAWKG